MASTGFRCEPHPDYPGWNSWEVTDPSRYNHAVIGTLLCRAEGSICRVRMPEIQRHHTNGGNGIHGGTTLGLIDIALFASAHMLKGVDAGGAVTLDLSTQFIGAADPTRPLDATTEVLRETRRLTFLRGLVVQDDDLVASFAGTIRKPSRP